MKIKKSDLISYSINFVSFLIKYIKIDNVILFGSVANGNFDEKSDIDIFIETNQSKKEIEKLLNLYEKSEENDKYKLIGIKNKIALKVGRLNEWKSLKRSIISNGLVLYGRYKENPTEMKPYLLFSISLGKIPRNKKIKLWRRLYGYIQKVGKKVYQTNGLVYKKVGNGGFIINMEKEDEVINLLKKEKVEYGIKEIWF